MAFRAASLAKHTRTLSATLSRRQQSSRSLLVPSPFSRSATTSSTPKPKPAHRPYPIDSLVADVLSTNDKVAADPPKRQRTRAEEKDYGIGLPPIEEWGEHFPWSNEAKARATVVNPETCKLLAEAFIPEGSRDKIVLEAFPGPGTLLRALINLPKERIKRLIIMEENPNYLKFLKPLAEHDPRVTVIPLSGYSWEAYEQVQALGLFDGVQKLDWSIEHPNLQFISHIPAKVHGEQLVSQFFRSIPEQQWLFKYGRIPLNLILSDSLWQRISAPPDDPTRCKLTVIADATASFEHVIHPKNLQPHGDHFYPNRSSYVQGCVALDIKPLADQMIQKGLMDEWDYCLRRLFVQKATPLKTSLPQLAPGASSILKKVTDESLPPSQRLNPKTPPRKLTAADWKFLVETFADWPFKPEDLSIDAFHSSRSRQEGRKV